MEVQTDACVMKLQVPIFVMAAWDYCNFSAECKFFGDLHVSYKERLAE